MYFVNDYCKFANNILQNIVYSVKLVLFQCSFKVWKHLSYFQVILHPLHCPCKCSVNILGFGTPGGHCRNGFNVNKANGM